MLNEFLGRYTYLHKHTHGPSDARNFKSYEREKRWKIIKLI